jgi:hypothetical protein
VDREKSEKLRRLLSASVLKENLAKAGLYTLAYECLVYSLVQRPKKWLTMCGTGPDDRYRAEILNLYPGSPFVASCLWFQQMGVLTAEEVNEIRRIRKHRTDIAHEPINVLLDTEVQVDEAKLFSIFSLLSKIDRWWLSEFEIPANPDFDNAYIDPAELRSGNMEFLSYLIWVVCGKETTSSSGA